MTPVMKPPMRNEIRRGQRWAKSLAGLTTLAAMLVASVAMHSDEHRDDQHERVRELAQHDDRVPDRLAVDDDRRRRHGHADEREQAPSSSAGRAPGRAPGRAASRRSG